MVCGDGVEGGRVERPLEVEDGCFVEAGQEAVVGIWRISPPERWTSNDNDKKSVMSRGTDGVRVRSSAREDGTYRRFYRPNRLQCFVP